MPKYGINSHAAANVLLFTVNDCRREGMGGILGASFYVLPLCVIPT